MRCQLLRDSDWAGMAHSLEIRVPLRGDKRELHETVTRNAKEEFTRHRLRRASDHNTRSRALTELQDLLGLRPVEDQADGHGRHPVHCYMRDGRETV